MDPIVSLRTPKNSAIKGKFAGVQPLGHAIRIEMAAFYTFDEQSGKLISERIYYDQASVVEQMQGKQRSALA